MILIYDFRKLHIIGCCIFKSAFQSLDNDIPHHKLWISITRFTQGGRVEIKNVLEIRCSSTWITLVII